MNPPVQPRLRRRDFLRVSLLGLAGSAVARHLGAASPGLGPIRRELFLAPPHPGITVVAATYYTRPRGGDLISIHVDQAQVDLADRAYFRFSTDNGRSWSRTEGVPMSEALPTGKRRQLPRQCLVDPTTGRLLYFWIEAVLPTDSTLEGMREYVTYYNVSEDGGYTWCLSEEIMAQGKEFNSAHPLPGVWKGRSTVMIGDIPSQPIALADGTILVPVEISPVGPDGTYANPGGGYTYVNVAVLRGRWAPDGRRLEWELSELVTIDPSLSTRGMDEPTLAVLADGRILLVIRGSNDNRPDLPGRRWVAYSSDQGRTWTKPKPWTYANGENFFSPSSSTQLLTHSSGRIFWIGHICPDNPDDDLPRYPVILGEVDRASGLLRKESIRIIDDRAPGESPLMQLASATAREDRENGEIVVNLTRWGVHSTVGPGPLSNWRKLKSGFDWTASAYLYHIPV